MNKLHQTVPLKALIDGGAFLRSKFASAFRLAQLILAFTVSMLFSAGAMAQSADAAIDVAKQWLALADADQAGQMWEQSAALMKGQSDRKAWVAYIGNLHSQFGPAPERRFWQALEHQIDHPSLPRGEFASVTFVSAYAKARAWERVALVWQDGRWAPVGYQYGAAEAAAK
jgi:hypothetical protein